MELNPDLKLSAFLGISWASFDIYYHHTIVFYDIFLFYKNYGLSSGFSSISLLSESFVLYYRKSKLSCPMSAFKLSWAWCK